MSLAVYVSGVVNASILIMLCIGFTFNYMMEKFPNFAHTSYASIGIIVTFYLVTFYGYNPYHTWPISASIGGLLGVLLYLVIVKPIRRTNGNAITLTFTFYILSQIISQGLALFSYWLLIVKHVQSQGFLLYKYDMRMFGMQAIGVIAPVTVLFIVTGLQLFLTRNKHGIAMRATAENENLASGLGVNVNMVHIVSWFFSGALSALSGSIISMWLTTTVNFSDTLLINVMAGSVLGGLDSMIGAVIGGLLTAFGAKMITLFLMSVVGPQMGTYEGLIPIIFLFVTLIIEPNGITSIKWREISVTGIKESLVRFRKTLWNVLTSE